MLSGELAAIDTGVAGAESGELGLVDVDVEPAAETVLVLLFMVLLGPLRRLGRYL